MNNRGQQFFHIITVAVAIVLTGVILFVSSYFRVEDFFKCEEVFFEVDNLCRYRKSVRGTFGNLGSVPFSVHPKKATSTDNPILEGNSHKTLSFSLTSEKAEFIPEIEYEKEKYMCYRKSFKVKLNEIRRC